MEHKQERNIFIYWIYLKNKAPEPLRKPCLFLDGYFYYLVSTAVIITCRVTMGSWLSSQSAISCSSRSLPSQRYIYLCLLGIAAFLSFRESILCLFFIHSDRYGILSLFIFTPSVQKRCSPAHSLIWDVGMRRVLKVSQNLC